MKIVNFKPKQEEIDEKNNVTSNTLNDMRPRSPIITHTPKSHNRAVVISIVEKTLINLGVLSKVCVGEKLGWTAAGHFVIQPPGYWTVAYRLINRTDRWATLHHIEDVINTAESMCSVSDGQRITNALKKSIHGIRNIQMTYDGDVLMTSSLEVLLDRLAERFGLQNDDLL